MSWLERTDIWPWDHDTSVIRHLRLETAPVNNYPPADQRWIDVSVALPPVGTEAIVLINRHIGDYWDTWRGQPLLETSTAFLRNIDSEGYAEWVDWELPSGSPIAQSGLCLVTHWQHLPKPLVPKSWRKPEYD